MKIFNNIFGIALAFVGAGMIVSCSSESEPGAKADKVGFAKAPEISIYSGSQDFYGTRAQEGDDAEVLSPKFTNEVEVNLAINDSHVNHDVAINDLVSKLSIHVRYGHDIDMTIPVPMQYVVEADDMAIVLSHQNLDEIWKGEGNEVSYTFAALDNKTVKLTVDYEDEYIHVKSQGIDDELMEYLYAEYGDGINFEIFNYYNNDEGLTRERLGSYLDLSTIKFDAQYYDELPLTFVNAYKLAPNDPLCVDREVNVDPEQSYNYPSFVLGPRNNGSDFNKIWTRNLPPVPVY